MTATLQDNLQVYGQYIEDIRHRVYTTTIVFALVFCLGFFFAGRILQAGFRLFNVAHVTIAASSPFQFVDLSMNVGLFCAILIICPFIVYQVYAFLRPAITQTEKRLFLSVLPVGLFLFISGFAYGMLTLVISLSALADLNNSIGVQNIWDVEKFSTEVAMTGLWLGIFFQFPIILSLLMRLGVFSHSAVSAKRRHVYAGILILVGLLPPTDILSLTILALPMVVLFELTLIINKARQRHSTATIVYV